MCRSRLFKPVSIDREICGGFGIIPAAELETVRQIAGLLAIAYFPVDCIVSFAENPENTVNCPGECF